MAIRRSVSVLVSAGTVAVATASSAQQTSHSPMLEQVDGSGITAPSTFRNQDPYYPNAAYQAPAPPPPQRPESSGFEMPSFSVRIDPFNWLLEGRLGLELEVELLDFMTAELIPVFVVSKQPPALNLRNAPDTLYQNSNGFGALSGTSVDLGFWLSGETFEGHVLRVVFTNYAYGYETEDDIGQIDAVEHTERHLYGMFGSHMRWGAFTIAGGIGLGVELNKQSRCPDTANTTGCDDSNLLIVIDREGSAADLNGLLHPAVIHGRISLGVVF